MDLKEVKMYSDYKILSGVCLVIFALSCIGLLALVLTMSVMSIRRLTAFACAGIASV